MAKKQADSSKPKPINPILAEAAEMAAADTAAKAAAREKSEAEEAAWHRPRVAYDNATTTIPSLKDLDLTNISRWELTPIAWYKAAHDWERGDAYKDYATKLSTDVVSLPHFKNPGVPRLVGLFMQSAYVSEPSTEEILTAVARMGKSREFSEIANQVAISIWNERPTDTLKIWAKGAATSRLSITDVDMAERPANTPAESYEGGLKLPYGAAREASKEFLEWERTQDSTRSRQSRADAWLKIEGVRGRHPDVTARQVADGARHLEKHTSKVI